VLVINGFIRGEDMRLLGISLAVLISTNAFGYDLPIKACFTEWYPYSYVKDNQPTGLSIDIYSAIIKRAGLTISYEMKPWARCKLEFFRGKFNALVDGNKDIPNSLNVKQGPISWVLLFWVHEKSPYQKYLGYSQFDNRNIGYVRGYTYPKEFLDYRRFYHKVDVTNDLKGLEILDKGRFDAFLGDLLNNNQLVKDKNLNVRALAPVVEHSYLTLSFSESLPDHHDKFEMALNQMYQDGSIDFFYKKHLGITYKKFIKKYVGE